MTQQSRSSGAGQALVEFALVLPVLVVLLMALFDGGRAVIYFTELTNASRVGARVAMVNQSNGTDCDSPVETFKCAASNTATAMGITPGTIADLRPLEGDCAAYGACSVTVRLEYSFQPVTLIVGELFGPIRLEASTTMAVERVFASAP